MLRMLVLAPLSLPLGEQSHELIDLLLGRPHQERPGLDADQRHAEGVSPLFPRQVKLDSFNELVDMMVEVQSLIHCDCVATN